ncbi:hypothetical protein BASA81_015513 [Batrachochytrium salamandrivorans]|nr:hypothetical protein BASA81_015513 [Batrachochytrium salamandrivorans]
MTSLYRSVIFLLSVATIQVQGGKDGLDQPELQPPTLQADSSSVRPKLLRPTRLTQKELVHQLKEEKKEEVEYSKFIECEDKYLETEYLYVKEPGTSKYGDDIQVATTKFDGSQVLLKTIEKKDVDLYQLESTSSSKTHVLKIDNEGGRKCKLPKPLNLLLPYEAEMQKYLTQPDHGSPYVLQVFDYAVKEDAYVLVMEYPGEGWMALDRYTTEQGKLSVVEVRLIAREVLKALLSLNAFGVVHGNVAAPNILYNEKTSKLKLMNFGYSGPLEKWDEDSSAKKPSDEKPDAWSTEEIDLAGLGKLMYHLVTLEDANQHPETRQEVQEKLRKNLDQRWLDGTVEHESMGTRHDNRALAARLADFLQVAYWQYQSTLWKYHRDRLVEVG